MKILVTGGFGFIGSSIANALYAHGHTVVLSDYPDSLNILNVHNIAYKYLHPDDILQCACEFDAIVHMGAISSTTELNGELIYQQNVRFTLNLAHACIAHGIKFVYASSASIYGAGDRGFVDSEEINQHVCYTPLNLYAWSKHYIDMHFIHEGLFSSGITFCGLRFFNVYGKNEGSKGRMGSVLSQNLSRILNGDTVSLFRNSSNPALPVEARRDFVSVELVNSMVLEALDRNISGIFNVGTGQALLFSEFISSAFNYAGHPSNIVFTEIPEDLVPRYQFLTEAEICKPSSVFGSCKEINPMSQLESFIAQQIK